MIAYDTIKTIDSLDEENLIKLYKFIQMIISSKRANASQQLQLMEIERYIENKIDANKIYVSSDSLSDSDFDDARQIFSNIKLNNRNNYKKDDEDEFTKNLKSFGIFALVVLGLAVIYGLAEGAIALWNNGILKVILGVALAGGGAYLGYKKGLFEKIKNKLAENNQTSKGKTTDNSESKEKIKEIGKTAAKVTGFIVKNLAITSSLVVVMSTGIAHLEKHTNVFDDTALDEFGEDIRYAYEFFGQIIREKAYELTNDYNDIEAKGYMNYIDTSNTSNNHNLNYYNGDRYLIVKNDTTWETLSYYCYNDIRSARHLKLYNGYYDMDDNYLPANTALFIPHPNVLENYVYEKRLYK